MRTVAFSLVIALWLMVVGRSQPPAAIEAPPPHAFYVSNSGIHDLTVSVKSSNPRAKWVEVKVYPGERRRILLLAETNYDIRIKVFEGPGWSELGVDDVPLLAATSGAGPILMPLVQWRIFDGHREIETVPYPEAGTVVVRGGNGQAGIDLSFAGARPNRPPVIK